MRSTILPLLAAAAIFLASCSSYYFASPQPVDRPDLRSIPRTLRGAWWSMEDFETPPDYSTPAKYTVERKRICIIETDSVTYIDRILTLEEASDTSRQRANDMSYAGLQRLDTTTGIIDTAINLIIRGGLAYAVDEKGIGRGYPFTRAGDTIRYVRSDTVVHELGHYLRVRKVEKSRWALNFLDGDQRDAKGWWTVLVAEHRGDTVYLHSALEKMQHHPSLIGEKDDKYHFTLDMRAADIGTMLRDSLLGPTILLVR